MEQLCINSFLCNGHEYHLYTYDEIKEIPKRTIQKDASAIITPDKIFKNKDRETYAGFSDLFRYKLLLENGGFWVDTDVVCLRPFNFISDYVFAKSRRRKAHDYHKEKFSIESCVIKSKPDSEIMHYCYEVSMNKNPQSIEWGEIGPDLLSYAIQKFNLNKYVARAETFCPIEWRLRHRFLSSSILVTWCEIIKLFLFRSKAVHLWNEMWRQDGIDKNRIFPRHCIYERLNKRYQNNV